MGEAAAGKTGSLATALAHAERLLTRDPKLAETQAREILRVVPASADAQHVLGLALGLQGRFADAIAALRRAVRLDGQHPHAWRALGDHLALAGDDSGAAEAYA